LNTLIPQLNDTTSLLSSERSVDLRELLGNMLRYKWVMIGTAVLLPIVAALYSMRLPKTYQATAVIEYDPTPTRPLGQHVEDVSDPIGSYWMSREWYDTQNKIIESRSIAEAVVLKLGLHRNRDFIQLPKEKDISNVTVEAAAGILGSRMNVEKEKETRIVKVNVKDRDPGRAMVIANAIVDAYIDKLMKDRVGSSVSALEWLSEQLDKQKKELEQSEMSLHMFKRENNILSVSMEDRQNIVANDIQRYSEALTNSRLRRIELTAKLSELHESDREDPLTVNNRWVSENTTIAALKVEYEKTAAKRRETATRLGDSHPEMKALDASLSTIKDQIRSEINGLIESTDADLKEIKIKENELQQALAQVNKAGFDLNLNEIEYRKLSRETQNSEKLYGMLLERTTETDLTRLMHVTNVKLVDRALKPSGAISPNIPLIVASAGLVGLFLGIGIVFVLVRSDTKLRTAEDVEALGLTVLGILPSIDDDSNKERKKRQRAKKRGTLKERESFSVDRDLIVHKMPKSSVAECCRTVRTNLMFMATSRPLTSLVVTSPNPLEGKTTVAISLAITMAQSGNRVLLVDTDLRRPRVARAFGVGKDAGVTSILLGEHSLEEAIQPCEVMGLSLLPSGPIPPNPSELLQTPGFTNLIEQAAGKFDRVVFDSPPLTVVTDAAIIAPQVSGVILVVHSDRTTRDAVRSSTKQLATVNANLLGAVVNGVDLSSNGRYGYGGYYYYYRGHNYYYYEADSDSKSPERSSAHPRA
jgi:polysaccharide biosynthesis transport protein